MSRQFLSAPLALAIALAFAGTSVHAQDGAAPIAFSIKAQPLAEALNDWARLTRIQLIAQQDLVAGKSAPGVSGALTPDQALAQLLAGSGLMATRTGKVIVIKPQPAAGNAASLAEVKVTAAAERSATSDGTGSYAARGATLFKGVQSLREIPQSISVLTRQQMDDQNITSVDAALEQMAGVSITGLAGEPVFWSRGYLMSAQIDGMQGTANEGRYANSLPALAMYDRIEVLRGVGGLLRGNGEPGGVINFVKKRPGHEPATSVRLQAGSWNSYYTELDVSRPLNAEGTLRGRAVLAYQNEDKFYDVATDEAKLAYGVLEYDLTPATTLGLSASYSRRNNTPFWGLPYNSDGSLPARSAFVGHDQDMHTEQVDVGLSLEHRFDNDWRFKAGYKQVHLDRAYVIAYGTTPIAANGLGGYQSGNDRYDSVDRSLDVSLSGPVQLGGRTHKLTVGYDRQYQNYTMGARWGAGTGWDLLNNHDFGALIPAEGNLTQYQTRRSGVYANAHIRPTDDWTVVLGGRWSNYDTKNRGITLPADWRVSNAKADHEFTPFGGVIWDMNPQVSLYGSYAEIFMPQSDVDYTGQVLKPRTGWQTELGAKGEFFGGRMNASIALFRIRDENRSIVDVLRSNCGASGTGACLTAAGLWQSQGWEAEVSGSPARGWDVSASYTQSKTEVLRAANPAAEGVMANVKTPEHLLKLWTQYRPGADLWDGALQGWTVGAGLYGTSRYGFSTTAPFQGGYATVSAKAGYRISPQWDVALLVGNLFDRKYLERVGPENYANIYGKPRNFTLTLNGRF
ncbi:TonB-dependent siderophore receptor [Acidovorax sp. CCYZU-2555]|uniref:TonB-dependent siderophore receptor n=1 Tax=Acidovorax sp. CCYZU-2555 TaxID=2835042 RepID=UPI001BD1A3C8|nr:TonB-dependent siderophore receptor [Acidovorax sp. CCYZU-2555]MBS7778338.1 TonB-dependent siderophore receptor [Acidovorax sp. CCYZU-2555]